MLRADPIIEHRDLVTRVLNTPGTDVPEQWDQVLTRWGTFTDQPSRDQLTDAIINGTGNITEARARAMAEYGRAPVDTAGLRNETARPVARALRNTYAEVATNNYKVIAEAFTTAGTRMTELVTRVDPDADTDTIATATKPARDAWLDAVTVAAELDQLADSLAAAAELITGKEPKPTMLLPLLTDLHGHKRRNIWEAWDTTDGRARRWAALARAGITIRAHNDPTNLEPYRRPKPIEERWIRTAHGSRRVTVDPEEETPNTAATKTATS